MEGSLDAGSIPASSMKKAAVIDGCFFLCGNRTARPRCNASREGPGGPFEPKPGLKGGYAAGGIPASSMKKAAVIDGCFFLCGNRTARPRCNASREGPEMLFSIWYGAAGS